MIDGLEQVSANQAQEATRQGEVSSEPQLPCAVCSGSRSDLGREIPDCDVREAGACAVTVCVQIVLEKVLFGFAHVQLLIQLNSSVQGVPL